MKPVIFKFDDFTKYSENSEIWIQLFEYFVERKIKASVGIVGNHILSKNMGMINFIKKYNDTGLFEFWNHGFSHIKFENGTTEFKGTSYDFQYASINSTQTAAKNILGITFSTFGAPFNATDTTTTKVLDKFPEITTWFQPQHNSSKDINLKITQPCEMPRSPLLNYDYFVGNFNRTRYRRYRVLQFHPSEWYKDDDIGVFFDIVDYITKNEEVRFITPSDYKNFFK